MLSINPNPHSSGETARGRVSGHLGFYTLKNELNPLQFHN